MSWRLSKCYVQDLKKGHWICLKFTKIKKSFPSAQWSGIHEPNQRKTFIHPISNQIVKFSEINSSSLSQTFQNAKLILLERVLDNDHQNSRLNKIIYFWARMLHWFFKSHQNKMKSDSWRVVIWITMNASQRLRKALFWKCLAGRCICECYARNADVWTNTHKSSKIYCSIFCSKSRLSYLILNFGDHDQEFFRVRSIWSFEKFCSTSLSIFSKISQFDWKWDVWKLFLSLAHEFSTIEHHKKRFLFLWISNKFNAPFKS